MTAGPVSVLLVDDHRDLAEAMERWLPGVPGFVWLGCAPNIDEAIDVVYARSPRLVLIELDGIVGDIAEAFEALQQAGPESRLIAFTEHVSAGMVRLVMLAGAAGFIMKETEPGVLLELLRDAASGREVMCPVAARAIQDISD